MKALERSAQRTLRFTQVLLITVSAAFIAWLASRGPGYVSPAGILAVMLPTYVVAAIQAFIMYRHLYSEMRRQGIGLTLQRGAFWALVGAFAVIVCVSIWTFVLSPVLRGAR